MSGMCVHYYLWPHCMVLTSPSLRDVLLFWAFNLGVYIGLRWLSHKLRRPSP